MNSLFIQGNKFKYNNTIYELDDMFSDHVFEECNEIAEKYVGEIWVVNEVFLNRVQPYKAIEIFLSGLDIESIELENPDNNLLPLVLDFAKNKGITVKGSSNFYKVKNVFYGQINLILTSIYLILKMLKIPHKSEVSSNKEKISLIRTPASKKKLSFLNDIDFRYEDFNDKNSIYNCFSKHKRIYWVTKSWITSYKEMKNYSKYIQNIIGPFSSANAYKYYGKRVVHTILYSIVIDVFLANNEGKKFYTGNNLDRFALIEEAAAKKHNIHTLCIPHGLEYGFKLPYCFIGDEFYTTSFNASLYLNQLYDTNKFIYRQDIAKNMFSVNYENKKSERDIVFFTEPREVEVNFKIIEGLIPLLNSKNLQLFVKLHPKDKKSDYDKYSKDIQLVEDFNSSISKNICISRKSTILLEAVYNNSDAAAILINNKDKVIFNTFPSLQDKSIKAFNSMDKLFEWILEKKK
ncbi:hypothetical protein [Proteocatella sphenisci]|uniref:hypothetical protein n=1 Tax=Proteocatella sphenisci TaxID=181070 RepID=UPI000491D049|nr:hypothetical protein [Proteocatella sphenisci]